MRIKKYLRRYAALFLGLRRLKDQALSVPLRRAPFFRCYPARVNISMVNRRGAVCRAPNFIYFRIPKAANSTITMTLQGVLNETRAGSLGRPGEAKAMFSPLSTLSRDEVEHLAERFYTFTFVRNPFTRIASAYLNKVGESDKQKAPVARWLGRDVREPISFPEFCTYLREGRGYLDDGHWARQTDLITLPLEELDYIGRIETLEQDLRQVVAGIFGQEREIQVVSWQRNVTGASARVRQLYSERELDIVREVYAGDFRAFGYDAERLP